ncbi:MAG: LamG-like jellyroll fold domain-containing protein, partial [Candidatus Hodarchaeales archaeon]
MTTNNKFRFVFPENQKKTSRQPTIKSMDYDSLGDFLTEREKIDRKLEENYEAKLRIDYSNFSSHVFFDSALKKFDIAKNRVLSDYPYNGSQEEKEVHYMSGSGYENYIFDIWPRYVGYVDFNGTDQYISASDYDNNLLIGTSSFYVSAWLRPVISNQNMILQVLSSSQSPVLKNGYELYLSGATDPHIKFDLSSGSNITSISAAYVDYTASFNNVGVIYDKAEDILYLYINEDLQTSSSVGFNSIEFSPTKVFVGSGSQSAAASSNFDFYSGSLDEIRVFHTSSTLFHIKNYSRPVYAENILKLNYKFNESVVGTGSIDRVIVDYSKSELHGIYLGYDSSKISGAVMLEDTGDPILYSFHSGVISFSSSIEISATLHDNSNNNNIFNMISENLLIEDELEESIMYNFSLSMARFFDELKLYVDQIDNLRITNYDTYNEVPDSFLPYLTRFFGWQTAEHYQDVELLPYFFGEGVLSSGSLSDSLFEIRNQFWRRMLNNLPYILETKGKRHSIDAFLNVLGVNKENIVLKEYGYLSEGSIDDARIHKQIPTPLLGIGTSSLGAYSASFAKTPSFIQTALSDYTVETLVQLPYVSASYSGTLTEGSVWQFIDSGQTESFTLYWDRSTLTSENGRFLMSSSDGQLFSSSLVTGIFDGDFVYVAAGRSQNKPFIELRTIDNDEIDFSASYSGDTEISGVFTGSDFDFIMGANSGSIFDKRTQGFYGEYRVWSRALSASEMDDHALDFRSVGINDPTEIPHPLMGHWELSENRV